MLAPGLPVPGASSEDAASCGPTRLRACADASCDAAAIKAATAMAQHHILVGPHPAMRLFSIAIAAISSRRGVASDGAVLQLMDAQGRATWPAIWPGPRSLAALW